MQKTVFFRKLRFWRKGGVPPFLAKMTIFEGPRSRPPKELENPQKPPKRAKNSQKWPFLPKFSLFLWKIAKNEHIKCKKVLKFCIRAKLHFSPFLAKSLIFGPFLIKFGHFGLFPFFHNYFFTTFYTSLQAWKPLFLTKNTPKTPIFSKNQCFFINSHFFNAKKAVKIPRGTPQKQPNRSYTSSKTPPFSHKKHKKWPFFDLFKLLKIHIFKIS